MICIQFLKSLNTHCSSLFIEDEIGKYIIFYLVITLFYRYLTDGNFRYECKDNYELVDET